MGSLNKVMLVGNLGRDAELRHTSTGTPVATLNLATTETWKGNDGTKQEKTEWHRIIVWGKTAEALEPYLKKGKQILVEGKLQTRKWESDKDGVTRYTTEIKSDRITLLGGGGQRDEADQRRGNDDHESGNQPSEEDIPF